MSLLIPDKTGICNIALSHLAIAIEIANVETEKSGQAAACRRFYAPALLESLRDFPNPFLIVNNPLALVSDNSLIPNSEWRFSYRYPADCAKAIRIPSGDRNDSAESRIPYRIMSDTQGRLIVTDAQSARLEYCINSDDPTKWAPDFLMAFSFLLAFYIAPRVTSGDPFKLGQRAYQAYIVSMPKSRANAIGEESPEQPQDPASIRARN